MAVTLAENVGANLESIEKARIEDFKQHPGGSDRVRVRVNYSDVLLRQAIFGTGPTHVSVFFQQEGDDVRIVGVGSITRKKDGKPVYSALWDGHQNRRVEVIVLGRM